MHLENRCNPLWHSAQPDEQRVCMVKESTAELPSDNEGINKQV